MAAVALEGQRIKTHKATAKAARCQSKASLQLEMQFCLFEELGVTLQAQSQCECRYSGRGNRRDLWDCTDHS